MTPARREAAAPPRAARRRRLRGVLLAMIAVLYLLSVPWYRGTGGTVEIFFGLPDWVAVALACYVAVAVLNAGAWLLTDVPDAPASKERRGGAER